MIFLTGPQRIQVQVDGQPPIQIDLDLPGHLLKALTNFCENYHDVLEHWCTLMLDTGTKAHHGWSFTEAFFLDRPYVAWVATAARCNPVIKMEGYMGKIAILFHLLTLILG